MTPVKNKIFVFIASWILGVVYLLSALGKYSGIESFKSLVADLGFPELLVYIIIAIEGILVTCFLLQLFLRKSALLSIIFLISLTLVYTYGHFRLGIDSCNCFGDIDFLNSSEYSIFLLRNSALLLISIFIFFRRNTFSSSWLLRLTSICFAGLMIYASIEFNSYYFKNFARKNIGKSLIELGVEYDLIQDTEYYFVYSPNCIHCRNAIPLINKLYTNHGVNIKGIIAEKMNSDFIKLKTEIEINFETQMVNTKVYKNLARNVPVIYEVMNDSITNTFSPKMLPLNMLSTRRINLSTHLPF